MRDSVVTDAETEQLWAGYSGRLLILLTVGFTAVHTGRMVLSPLLPAVIESLAITPFEAGIALSVLLWMNAAMQYPSGHLSDQLSRKTVIVASFLAAVAGFVILGLTSTYIVLLLGAAAIGLGSGLYPPASLALLSDLFVEKRGQAIGVNIVSIDLGSALSAGLAVIVMTYATWQVAFLPVLVATVLAVVLLHFWSKEPYVIARPKFPIRKTIQNFLGDRRMRWTLIGYSFYMFTWQGIAGFLPTYLAVEKNLSATIASAGFALLFLVGIVVKPFAGRVGDRSGHLRTATASAIVGVIGLAALIVSSTLLGITLGIVAFAVGLNAFSPPMLAYLMNQFPDISMGGDIGVTRTVYIGIGSFGPIFVGYVASYATYSAAFIGLLTTLLGSAVILVWLEY